ncbi:MAG TPA: ABC transporter permease, partial [Gemmatimonadaceae bacterium]|nr:ABC transporter permease [Gemmatimonadaceae bacterium]
MRNPFSSRRLSRPFEKKPDAEVADELAFHLEERAREYVARGMAPDEARAAAQERLGDLTVVRRECAELIDEDRRATARRDWLDDLRQDLRFGFRSALRAPLFSLLAIVTLAVGIGANAAVFGVLKSVLLDALPYADADRVVRVYGRLLDGTEDRAPLSAGTVIDVRERQRSFARLAAFAGLTREAVYIADDGPHVVNIALVEPDFFRTLGVAAALGRALREDDAVPDSTPVMVLSHAAWQRFFGGDPAAVGRKIRINGISCELVGVLPRGFVGPVEGADMYYPLNMQPTLRDPIRARRQQWLGAVGRLQPGVTVDAAQRELAGIFADLARQYPQDNGSFTVNAVPVRDALVGDTRTPLIVLMASAGLVLLIACANLAGALLARTLSRRKEFAVRVALGAGRGRLVRQLLTESLVLAIAGGLAGIILAKLGLGVLRGLALPALPAYAELSLDTGALVVTSVLAILTGVAFGLAPAIAAGRADPQVGLREETRSASEAQGARHLRGVLVAGQIALCVSLLAGAGLLVRSLIAMTTAPLGFEPHGVLTAAVQLPMQQYQDEEPRARFLDQFEERLRALPGVSAVASVGELPTKVMNRNGFNIEGKPLPPNDAQPFVRYVEVSPDYFRTLRIPVLSGRVFGVADRAGSPQVVVVSQGMARRYWGTDDPVGSRVRLGPDPNGPAFTVIGVVGDVRNDPAVQEAEPMLYGANRQMPWNGPFFLIRTSGDPLQLVKPMQRALAELDQSLPLHNPMTLDSIVDDGFASRRLPVVLMSAFGALALLLASVGVYAMFASMAAARER